jgi:PAS domain-containing protein
MLSTVFLSFEDREMRLTFEREKKVYYARVLLIIWIVLILLTAGLFVVENIEDTGYTGDTMTHYINIVATVVFFLLWIFVRKFAICSWFVCPLLTAYAFYYFAIVDYDGSQMSVYYTLIVGITCTFFILVIFNESWALSALVYAPLLAYYMHKSGKDMVGSEINELVIRCIFCVFLYAIVAYKVEMLNKQAFLGQQTSEKAFYRWLKIFETFPEGLALIRRGQILYANRSFSGMFELGDYESNKDPYNENL